MTREERVDWLCRLRADLNNGVIFTPWNKEFTEALTSILEQESKIKRCKNCRWWKDSDGAFRRGIGAESQCPINKEEVYEGNGYCYMFEPQESEGEE